MEEESSTESIIHEVMAVVVRAIFLSIGTFLYLKLIHICKEEKDKVWMITLAKSVGTIALMVICVIFETLTYYAPGFSHYTGYSICYIAAFGYVYLPYLVFLDSMCLAMMKYVFIVHTEKSKKYGEEKIQKVFLWVFVLHGFLPSIITVFLYDFEAYAQLISCFELEERFQERYNSSTGNEQRMFLCKLRVADGEDLGTHYAYTLAQGFCATKMVVNLAFMSNIPEAYFYYKIFQKMKRYKIIFHIYIKI